MARRLNSFASLDLSDDDDDEAGGRGAIVFSSGNDARVGPGKPGASKGEFLQKFNGGPTVDTAVMPCPTAMNERGVDVGWLLAWTELHQLWDMKTEDVVYRVIKPLTEHLRCRFVELASQIGPSAPATLLAASQQPGPTGEAVPSMVGEAHCFVSHCWQCPFGDVVAAAVDNSRPGRRVWVDVFAVNQHEVRPLVPARPGPHPRATPFSPHDVGTTAPSPALPV